jgi:hypothetical protein
MIHAGLCFLESPNPVDHPDCLLAQMFINAENSGASVLQTLRLAIQFDRQQDRNNDDTMRSYA